MKPASSRKDRESSAKINVQSLSLPQSMMSPSSQLTKRNTHNQVQPDPEAVRQFMAMMMQQQQQQQQNIGLPMINNNATTTITVPNNNNTAGVNGWVWQNPDGTVVQQPPAPPPSQQQQQQQPPPPQQQQQRVYHYGAGGGMDDVNCGGWGLFLLIIVILFVLFIVFFIPFGYYYRPPPPGPPVPPLGGVRIGGGSGRKDKPEDCTVDEVFNTELEMCLMNVHAPYAVTDTIMDPKVSPCTDFYRYACGKWIDTHINESRGFAGLTETNWANIKKIIEDPTVPELNPFYGSCKATLVDKKNRRQDLLDTKLTREAILGRMLDPLVSVNDLPIVFARMNAAGFKVPFSFSVMGHPAERGVIPMFSYDGFTGREMELDWVKMHFEVLYGIENTVKVEQEAKALIDMVTRLNMAKPDNHEALDTYEGWRNYIEGEGFRKDHMSWSEFKRLSTSGFKWDIYLKELSSRMQLSSLRFAEEQIVWAMSRDYFEWLHPEKFSTDDWRRFVTFSVLYHTHDFFPDLPGDILFHTPAAGFRMGVHRPTMRKKRLSFPHYGYLRHGSGVSQHMDKHQQRVGFFSEQNSNNNNNLQLSGGGRKSAVPGPDDGEEYVITDGDCARATQYMLPGILSKEFLKRYFQRGEEIRSRVRAMVEGIRDRFVKNIRETKWLDNDTRNALAEKIQTIIPRVVHPTEWSEEVFPLGKEMDRTRYLRNIMIIQEEHVRRNLALWSESNYGANCDVRCRDKITLFGSPLFTVNAWYNPDRNTITVPAGILQPPFFDERYTDASAMGTIGWVVAHELSHALDIHGIMYDKYGILRNIWSANALKGYKEHSACIVNEYTSPEGCNIDNYGKQTLGENFADHNGVRIAYESLFLDKDGKTNTTVEAKREFFLAGGQMWCASYTKEVLCGRSRDDVHSQAGDRVKKTFAHLPYFAEAFGCPVGSPMHRKQGERCVVFGGESAK